MGGGSFLEALSCGCFAPRPSHAENFRKTRKNRNPFVAFQRHPAGPEAPALLDCGGSVTPSRGPARRKAENGHQAPVGGEQEQDGTTYAPTTRTRLQGHPGPSARCCYAGVSRPGRSTRFKIVIGPFRFR